MPFASGPATERLDVAVVKRGLAETRARAQALIMGGGVLVDDQVVNRAAHPVSAAARIALVNAPLPYVSRGGLKLRHALDVFDVDVRDSVAVDVGASTGGFTDVLLQAGARRVYAVDVGYGQLAWSLRNDPRVVVMERTNIRHLDRLPELAGLAVIDTSFISLRLVLPATARLVKPAGDVIALIKPQFEAGPSRIRKGVVRDPHVWKDVLDDIVALVGENGWTAAGLERSPVRGPAGNVEFLVHLILVDDPSRSVDTEAEIDRVLQQPDAVEP